MSLVANMTGGYLLVAWAVSGCLVAIRKAARRSMILSTRVTNSLLLFGSVIARIACVLLLLVSPRHCGLIIF